MNQDTQDTDGALLIVEMVDRALFRAEQRIEAGYAVAEEQRITESTRAAFDRLRPLLLAAPQLAIVATTCAQLFNKTLPEDTSITWRITHNRSHAVGRLLHALRAAEELS